MARIFITGSADGLGKLAAGALINQGHQVVLHARNQKRAQHILTQIQGAETVVTADLSSIAETKNLALELNAIGRFDAVIHNAGLYQVSNLDLSVDGLPVLLAVNTIAPYLLTSLMDKPGRLIYLSSGMHLQGDPTLRGLAGTKPRVSYSDSKLHDLILAKAVARKWSGIHANAVDPGWVPTKMGGAGAPDDLEKGYQTQVWLAASQDVKARVTGRYFHHQRSANYLSKADDISTQEQFLTLCEQISGVHFPSQSH
ncbi:SDR family NAD(P)-dependent oxidoreductase [Spirosoma utsteinense]|uniref:NAD(P)-dependent dehydrogenase (Short-subunit alcohol dehydrogenase family) n=1 Tax=Spirosoma utsteinense TaxID=2585773 RepID=A0ABR6WES4_9BACT|nr:SDR family NAD(P)-dependent oxidoreductase [Spirosoma utsteinense]MBC3788294.1 NAD(P)-dependent dehydrogenase (short-subunit alcohol dehydrogenase family) [Spirosoma utsteinense]MBC3794993.1 NAD(P)-dependent dehydrogenase (short-subunit alcohol dehydrogenase family) [Spirosoma utsteinense]